MFSIVIHLGINPKKGGRPPKESNGTLNNNFLILFFIEKENIWFKFQILKFINIIMMFKDNKE